MAVRGFATFDAQFSQDPVVVDGEEQPPGRELMECLVAGLKQLGLRCTEVAQHDAYGWYSEVGVGDKTIWCMLQLSDNWMLISRPLTSLLKRLFTKDVAEQEHQRVCEQIASVLRHDPRVSNVRWFTEQELHSGATGEAHP